MLFGEYAKNLSISYGSLSRSLKEFIFMSQSNIEESKHQCRIPILPRLICLGWPKTEAYNGVVAFLQLEPSFRPRFSKYPKPKSGIGPGSLKTGAKEGYRPRSSRTRSQKVAGSQGYRPRSKETRCQKGVNCFSSSNNRSHRVYLGFKIHKAFFLPAPPLQFHFLSLREALPSLSLSSSFTVRIPRRRADGMVVVTDTGAGKR